MTLPANIRVNVTVPFPTLVYGSGFLTITKSNGIWRFAVDYTLLPQISALANPFEKVVVVYDQTTKIYNTVSLSTIAASVVGPYRLITAAGDVAVLTSDVSILMNKTVGAATNINLPTSISRNGVPLTVKDYKGDSHTNNITFVPSGSETIDGFSGAAAAANGTALIDINYGKKTLYPLSSGGWYL